MGGPCRPTIHHFISLLPILLITLYISIGVYFDARQQHQSDAFPSSHCCRWLGVALGLHRSIATYTAITATYCSKFVLEHMAWRCQAISMARMANILDGGTGMIDKVRLHCVSLRLPEPS